MDAIDVDATTPEDIVVDRERDSVLWGAVRSLGDRTWNIMQLRFGRLNEPMRLDDIGQLYGITRERVRQIESATLAKLRDPASPLPGSWRPLCCVRSFRRSP